MFAIILLFLLFAISYSRSFYDVLGVSIYADQKEIKKAYYHLALTLHPDKIRNPTEEDKSRYMEIVKAYETLSDPEKKKVYDLSGGDSDEDVIIPNSYTDQLFKFKSFTSSYRFEATFTPRLVSQAPSIILTFPIRLQELFTGISHRIIRYNRTSICSVCNATGADSHQHVHKCNACQGTGLREYPTLFSSSAGMSYSSLCNVCHGSGYQPDKTHTCPFCRGSGVMTTIEDFIDLNLHAGIRSNYQSIHRGLGNEQFKRRRGDVIVKLQVIEKGLFEVDDYSLHTNMTLSVMEALVGFERELFLPSNQTITVRRTMRTPDGSVMTIQNGGIPLGSSGLIGSLFVHFSIHYPWVLSRKQKEMIQSRFGEESEEIIDFIQYHAELQMKQNSEMLNYPLTVEEFSYSSSSSSAYQCLFSIMDLYD